MRITGTAVRQKVGVLMLLALLLPGLRADAAASGAPVPPRRPDAVAVSATVEDFGAGPSSGLVPRPGRRPDFSRPDILRLLHFGLTPRPQEKPSLGRYRVDSTGRLGAKDAGLYREIFAQQARANWDKADELIARLGDQSLRGHVLYQRYIHPTAYKAEFAELSAWLDLYADHPGAERIYRLAQLRRPAHFKGMLRKPEGAKSPNGFLGILSDSGSAYASPRPRSREEVRTVDALLSAIRADLFRADPLTASDRLRRSAGLLDSVEYDRAQADIAERYMYNGDLETALNLASQSVLRSADKAPVAGWVGGLASWRQGSFKQAASFFELAASSSYSPRWMSSAAAYWASRSHMRAGNVQQVNRWLREAARSPRTFYGLIATRALGWDFDFDWSVPGYTDGHKKMMMETPGARRAMALVAAGQNQLAEQELRQLGLREDTELSEAVLAYASHAGLPALALQLAEGMADPDGGVYDAALYPLSPWQPSGGYKVDRALINAIIRQESRFDPFAESSSGAAGLMQLMPATASFVSGDKAFRKDGGRHILKDPQINLDIGQRYVEDLLNDRQVSMDLFSLVIAYNAGPGNLRKWKAQHGGNGDDPLLFIESIPVAQTRDFVERVMANYWIYRLRFDQPVPSLDAVAEGHWARYVELDGMDKGYKVAKN